MTETSEESANEDTRLVETTVDGHVAIVRLRRPPHNGSRPTRPKACRIGIAEHIAGRLSEVADPTEITNSIAQGSPAAVAATRTALAFTDLRDGS